MSGLSGSAIGPGRGSRAGSSAIEVGWHDGVVTARPIVLFDGNCGFCTAVTQWGTERWPAAVDVIPWQQADLRALGLDASQCERELQFVGVDGDHAGGAQAIGRWLETVGGLWKVPGRLACIRPTSWIADGVYKLVADNRRRLPGVQPACQRHRCA